MPNWCECELEVYGKKNDVLIFKEFAGDNNDKLLDEQNFIPYPEKFREQDKVAEAWDANARYTKQHGPRPKDGYNSGGYKWCVENWGTKWGFTNNTWIEQENQWDDIMEIIYRFDTAWSPPRPLIEAMGEQYPHLTFTLRYFERGAAFNGYFQVAVGEVVTDKQGDYFGHRGG